MDTPTCIMCSKKTKDLSTKMMCSKCEFKVKTNTEGKKVCGNLYAKCCYSIMEVSDTKATCEKCRNKNKKNRLLLTERKEQLNNDETRKVCHKCNTDKDIKEFIKNGDTLNVCEECRYRERNTHDLCFEKKENTVVNGHKICIKCTKCKDIKQFMKDNTELGTCRECRDKLYPDKEEHAKYMREYRARKQTKP